ncbi:unnamed protein product [Urochloa decumbens]|uniref:F-box domain-containing protein n=1 Tax=Urochloa decumbens TaxID=240449 RepID=A0ABC9BLG5_9POAL
MADGGTCLPDDVLVQIFLLIPTYFRRPLRLVRKRWRTVIDERVPPEETLPAKILVFINQGSTSSALVFDGSSRHRERAWTYTSSSGDADGSARMVGTCNGLLCLHDHSTFAGYSSFAVTVTNPATGETVALPPVLPWCSPSAATAMHGVGETAWSSWVMAPQLTHGDCVLSASRDEWDYASSRRRKRTLHRHDAGELADGGGDGWQLPPAKGAQLIMSSEEREGELTTFAYVETRNPVPR